jgi:DNA-directed RNA polymerase I, II, and III subunit RPABC1
MNNQELIHNSFKTLLEMFNDRKIDVLDINETILQETLISNASKIGFSIELSASTTASTIKIIYYLASKFKWSELKKFFEDLSDQDNTLYILIVADKISQNNMKSIYALNLNLQIFNIKELQFNITKHVLVPKHEVVNDQNEIKSILDNYCLKSKFQLPLMLKTDPVSRYFGLKNGDIVKIIRNSPTSGEYIVYRCCM